MNNEYAHWVKWLPETQVVRRALAESYRNSRKENAALTRLVYRRVRKASDEIASKVYADLYG